MAKYFVSYRRGSDIRAIAARLGKAFGPENVITDEDSQGAVTIDGFIDQSLGQCAAALLVIDAHWSSQMGRLLNPSDWVRVEVDAALVSRIPLVPLLINGCQMPREEGLPRPLRVFVHFVGHRVDAATFDDDMNGVVRHLRRIGEGHEWARARIKDVLDQVHAGRWAQARERSEAALREANEVVERRHNGMFFKLRDLGRRVATLSEAEKAFRSGHFAYVKFLLADDCRADGAGSFARELALVAGIACGLADIGLASAKALCQRDRESIRVQRGRLSSLTRRHRGLAVPGCGKVRTFIREGEKTLDTMDRLQTRVAELHQRAMRSFDPPFPGPSIGVAGPDVLADYTEAVDEYYEVSSALAKYTRAIHRYYRFFSDTLGRKVSPGPTRQNGAVFEESHIYNVLDKAVLASSLDDQVALTWRWLIRQFGGDVRTEAPHGTIQFTVTAPSTIQRGTESRVMIWGHRVGEQQAVIKLARHLAIGQLLGAPEIAALASMLSLRVKADGFMLGPKDGPMFLNGAYLRSTFWLQCPDSVPLGMYPITVDVYADALKISTLGFSLEVGEQTHDVDYIESVENRVRRVFASFAKEDEGTVVARLERLRRMVPWLDINLTCEVLRRDPGWSDRMASYIRNQDLFCLFWSPHAASSTSVEQEWQCALQEGSDFLSAVVVADGAAQPVALKSVPFYCWDRGQPLS